MRSKIICCFFIYCLFSNILFAQQFVRVDSIPVFQNGIQLKNPWAGGLNNPLFSEIDLNGDGIKDLFTFDKSNGRLEFFLNQGIADSADYIFSPVYFNSFPYLHDWALLYDYNCDGKDDIFAFSDDFKGIKVYENISTPGNLQFKLISPELTTLKDSVSEIIQINALAYPALSDIDNDGDMDILDLTFGQPRTAEFNKNMSEENGWGCDSLVFKYETECWGNFSFAVGPNVVGNWNYTCDGNSGIEARVDDSVTNVFAFDETGNGVKDLLIGDLASNNSLLIVNGGTPDAANMVSQDATFPSYDVPINLFEFTNHAYLDVNNDGKKDLIVTCTDESNINDVLLYKNVSSTAAPVFQYQENSFLQDQMIDVGEGCYPVFFDYNNDGLMDIVIGNNNYNPQLNGVGTALALYQNIGTATSPAFELITTDFANVSELNLTGAIYPAFGDLNGDRKPDMIIGNGNGNLQYFVNTAPAGQPATFQLVAPDYFNIYVGQYATPQLVDLDHDGLLDLVVGERDGYLKYFHNTGTKDSAIFNSTPDINDLGHANTNYEITEGYSVPFIYNDRNGNYEMFLAGQQGYILHYTNIDNNLNGVFTLTDTLLSNASEGQRISVCGADLNNDGLIDLIVGNYAGGAGIFSTNMPLAVQNYTEIKPSFELSPNPAASFLTVHLFDLNENNARISIVDMLGRKVENTLANSTTVNLDISYLANGVYMVELQSAKYNVTKKLIIQH